MAIKKNNQYPFYFSVLLLLWIGCVQDGNLDREPPVFRIISFDPEPKEAVICGSLEQVVFSVEDDDTIKLQVEFEDPGGLSEYKIDIHNNFDCHGHRSETEDWFLQKVEILNGSREVREVILPVPTNATAGNYHFGLLASDDSGNVTDQTFFYSVQITNRADTVAPQLELVSPIETTLNVTRGEKVVLAFQLQDDRILSTGGNAGIHILSRRSLGGNVITQQELDFTDINSNLILFETEFSVPLIWTRDSYDLILVGFDGVRNESNQIILSLNVQ